MWYNVTKKEQAIIREELAKFLNDTTVDESKTEPKDHKCEEGMTPLDGHFICKHCGDNLRSVK